MGAKYRKNLSASSSSFNPRTRDGCEVAKDLDVMLAVVSIHAPVMGANVHQYHINQSESFNPRTRDGCEYNF